MDVRDVKKVLNRKPIGKWLAYTILILGAVLFSTVAYYATRPGGFRGEGLTLTERMAIDAKNRGVKSPNEFYYPTTSTDVSKKDKSSG